MNDRYGVTAWYSSSTCPRNPTLSSAGLLFRTAVCGSDFLFLVDYKVTQGASVNGNPRCKKGSTHQPSVLQCIKTRLQNQNLY